MGRDARAFAALVAVVIIAGVLSVWALRETVQFIGNMLRILGG